MQIILVLAVTLILSAVASVGSLQPVLGAFGLFAALYILCLAGCLVPSYVRIRAARSVGRSVARPHPPARPAVLRSGVPASSR
jgi:hypothetical protein